jgi:co-chaperonin GroES (HSP10)
MASDSYQYEAQLSMNEAFPDVDPGLIPLGGRVLVQMKRTSKKTQGGLIIVEDTAETVKWNQQTAKVIALGPLAYRNRESLAAWKEGAWVKEGDFVRVPRWNGDRIEIPVKDAEPVIFVIFNDHELVSKITGDPLSQKAYIL